MTSTTTTTTSCSCDLRRGTDPFTTPPLSCEEPPPPSRFCGGLLARSDDDAALRKHQSRGRPDGEDNRGSGESAGAGAGDDGDNVQGLDGQQQVDGEQKKDHADVDGITISTSKPTVTPDPWRRERVPAVLVNREEEVAKLQDAYSRAVLLKGGDEWGGGGGRHQKKQQKQQKQRRRSSRNSKRRETAALPPPSTCPAPLTRHLALVVGAEGCGKTTLVRTALKDLVRQQDGGYFLEGRYDALDYAQPFAPFCEIATQLIEQVLSTSRNESPPLEQPSIVLNEVHRMQTALRGAMEPCELQALAGIVPKLTELLPELQQRATADLAHRQTSSRPASNSFVIAFASFMRAVSTSSPAAASYSPPGSTAASSSFGSDMGGSCHSTGTASYTSSHSNTTCVTATPAFPPTSSPPIVFFLDNVEQIDEASLHVLRVLVTDPMIRNLLVVLAFSPVEMDHPLNQWLKTLESIQSTGSDGATSVPAVQFCPVVPSPLGATAVYEWLQRRGDDRTLGLENDELQQWSTYIAEYSQGHPFVLSLVVQRLVQEQREQGKLPGAAMMNHDLHRLLHRYRQQHGSSNMARLVQDHFVEIKISALAQQICQVAACIGLEDIDERVIQLVLGKTNIDLESSLREAVDRGILVLQSSHPSPQPWCKYAFTSSTYRNALYATIACDDLSLYHAKLGKILSEALPGSNAGGSFDESRPPDTYGSVFRAVAYLQRGFVRLTERAQENFAELCGEAGRRSVEWSQFERGCQYYLLAIKTLETIDSVAALSVDTSDTKNRSSKWKTSHYTLIIRLHLGVANASCQLGNFDDCSAFLDAVIYQIKNHHHKRSTSLCDKAHAKAIQIRVLTMQDRHESAIALGLKILLKLGESVKPSHDLAATRKLLEQHLQPSHGNVQISAIVNRPMLKETNCLEAMTILHLLVAPVILTQGALLSSIAYRMVKISLVNGFCAIASVGFAIAAALFKSDGDVQNGSLCEETSRHIDRIMGDKECRGRCLVILNGLSLPQPGYQAQLKLAYRLCNDVEDSEFTMMSTVVSVTDMFVSGGCLKPTAEAMKGVYQLLGKNQNDRLLRVIRPFFQMTLNLLGVSQAANHRHLPHALVGNVVTDVEEELEYAKISKNAMAEFSICVCQAVLAFYMHRFDKCRDAVERCTQIKSPGTLLASLDVLLSFFDAMSAICFLWQEARASDSKSKDAAKQKKKYLGIAERALSKLETYAVTSPTLVNSKILMIKAELQMLSGQTNEALLLYHQAIDHSIVNGIICDRALACERAGLALRVTRNEDQALNFLEDSCAFYRQYGAAMKVNHIKGNVIPSCND